MVFTIYGHGNHLDKHEQTFVPPSYGVSTWNLASIFPAFSEENMFEECRYYKLINKPKGSGEIKSIFINSEEEPS